ncbi:MAG: beta-galactosidase, partial [Bryobacteraceae bacterium]
MNRRAFLQSNAAALALPFVNAPGAGADPMPQQLLFGADYYPDQTDESLWAQDAKMMSEFGITNVRVAEFAWGLMEPEEGRFAFDWLRRAVHLLHSHNIAVILGTPSAAPPPWLTQKYPEVFEVNDKGTTLSPEGRRFTCPTNKTYRRLALSIATAMAQSFADTPGVVGWQIDNELTLGSSPRCYCKYCRAGFQDWLRAKYATLHALNKIWGTVFWSQGYTDFSQIPVPLPSGAPPNPGMALDYDRYQSYANVSFLEEQLAMLRKTCPNHFITTNNVALADTIDLRRLFAKLDFASGDNYPGYIMTHMAVAGGNPTPEQIAPIISMSHDFMRSVKQGKPFFIMEEQTGKAGQPTFCPQPEKGQLRLWSYQAVAHGAMGINYFRWDTATFGAEEYWHGLLNHHRSKSPGYDEIRQTVHELKALGHDALNAPYPAEAALCFDYSSDWAFAIQPGQPKLKRYSSEAMAWYGSLWGGQTAMDLIDATLDLSRYKILFAPVMYVVSKKQADNMRNFVQNGGTLVASYRLGVKTSSSQIVKMPLPGLLRDVMGVTVEDYVPMYWQKQGVKFSQALSGPDAECEV